MSPTLRLVIASWLLAWVFLVSLRFLAIDWPSDLTFFDILFFHMLTWGAFFFTGWWYQEDD